MDINFIILWMSGQVEKGGVEGTGVEARSERASLFNELIYLDVKLDNSEHDNGE